MDIYRKVSVSGALPSEYQREKVVSPASSKLGGCSSSLEELFPGENMEGDVNLEWLSIFVEDCLSSTTNYTPTPTTIHLQNPPPKTPNKPSLQLQELVIPGKARTKRKRATPPPPNKPSLQLQELVIPGKARTKRKRATPPPPPKEAKLSNVSYVQDQHQTDHGTTSDPPLLHQAYWLADSELLVYKKEEEKTAEDDVEGKGSGLGSLDGSVGQPRRCTHCLSQKTPQWRAGPLGPKTLCNACGVRYKSGRLLPEYRPAKSPTFESYKHSNSHKKVMEMRKSIIPSDPNQ